MALKLYNTLTRSLDVFDPMEAGRVRVYACGPTIYGHAHIGNYRSFIVYDLLHRYLEWSGYGVRFVVNLTDVDDKTIDGALAEGVTIAEYTPPFAASYVDGARTLGIRDVDAYPLATRYIPRMVEFVQRLVDSGHGYVAEDGSVYFSIASFPEYGKLSGVDLDAVKPGARVAVDEYDKDDVRDFVLWKAAKGRDEEAGAAWDSPWGRGRPGWHLECSVMSLAELGESLDIHLGGEDLVFPHHEDEIAQSEAATGKPFARYWLHVKHLRVDGRKMSKSLGNFIVLRDLLDEGYSPAAIRHLLLSAHYRAELNFTREGLDASARAVRRLLDFERRLDDTPVSDGAPTSALPGLAATALDQFRTALDSDLNSPDALAAVFVLVSRVNSALDAAPAVRPSEREDALRALRSMDEALGLLEVARRDLGVDTETEAWIEDMIRQRADARRSRDFQRADEIRDELAAAGVVLEDASGGTRYKIVRAAPEPGS
ncbi:MAG TPA: cysteine--tRNA ligase [Longimicrobiales bacterium]|jgi:cysteinyl-tRNA synthetase